MMARGIGVALVCGFVGMVSGCSTSAAPGADAAVDVATTPPPASTASAATVDASTTAASGSTAEASNAGDVVRHAGDKVLDHVAVTVKYASGAPATTECGSGKAVATLKAGTAAAAVGQYNGCKRVIFADPKDATKKLEGWVQNYVFASGFEGHPVPVCPLNEMLVSDAASPLTPRCTTRCKTAADCHGTTKYCYDALVLMTEAGGDPPATTAIASCGANADLAPKPAASAHH